MSCRKWSRFIKRKGIYHIFEREYNIKALAGWKNRKKSWRKEKEEEKLKKGNGGRKVEERRKGKKRWRKKKEEKLRKGKRNLRERRIKISNSARGKERNNPWRGRKVCLLSKCVIRNITRIIFVCSKL